MFFSFPEKPTKQWKGELIFLHIRTDLAEEQMGRQQHVPEGACISQLNWEGAAVSLVSIREKGAAQILGKPIGEYYTIRCGSFCESASREGAAAAARAFSLLLPPKGPVLVAGLGNRQVTPDSLGPATVRLLPPTRQIPSDRLEAAGLCADRPCAVFAPGVSGQTGMDSAEVVLALVRKIRPAAVIAVDALAAGDVSRLGNTIQICSTGISPGSGVANRRPELSARTIGVPVIAAGVPTVADFPQSGTALMVTPREVDAMILNAARTLASAVLRAIQPSVSPEEVGLLLEQ